MTNKGHKRYADWEEKIKLSLFVDNIIIYIENVKEYKNALLKLISNYIQVTEYQINIKNQLLSYISATNN